MIEVSKLKNEYLNWISKNMETASMTETTARFTLPFLDFNNDHIEVYLKKENDEYVITDIGETISDLRLSNFKINSRRNEILNSYIQSYGVEKMKTKFLFVVQ